MKNKFENLLLSLLLGLSVLLGLSFWLNTVFGFNLFFREHWIELSKLQAEHVPISSGFYISIGIAIFIFVFGLCFIYVPAIRRISKKETPLKSVTNKESEQPVTPIPEPSPEPKNETKINVIPMARPPRLNLPSNMAKVLQQRTQQTSEPVQPKQQNTSGNPYNPTLAQIFTDSGYIVKKNPTISGFTPNLFAIAPNEIIWIGAVDSDINKLQSAINRLQSIFQETLEDIPININAFMLDTTRTQTSSDSIFIFNSLDELKKFVSELPPVWSKEMTDAEQENFDSYSEYIDTIIQYVKTVG